jgi:DNA-binding transcriptional regulator LsrR (DeoR family)
MKPGRDRRPTETDREESMTLAAWLYHERDMDQSEVARRMGLSRSHVSRLLLAARESGIVTVRVNGRLPEAWRLEQRLEQILGLEQVAVVMPVDGEEPRLAAARSGARLLDDAVRTDGTVGLGWGRTLGLIARFARPQQVANVELFDIVGRPVWPIDDPPYEVSEALARIYGTPVRHVPAPALVETTELAEALLRDPLVHDVLTKASAADLTVVALGNVDPATSSLVLSGATDPEAVASVRDAGAVGEVIGHFFNRDGAAVPSGLDGRIVGLSLEQLRRSVRVVAIAAGPDKVAPILGATTGGLIRGLVTDAQTAKMLIADR